MAKRMTTREVKILKVDVQETLNELLIKLNSANLPIEDGSGDVEYLEKMRDSLNNIVNPDDAQDDYTDSYYDSGCTDY